MFPTTFIGKKATARVNFLGHSRIIHPRITEIELIVLEISQENFFLFGALVLRPDTAQMTVLHRTNRTFSWIIWPFLPFGIFWMGEIFKIDKIYAISFFLMTTVDKIIRNYFPKSYYVTKCRYNIRVAFVNIINNKKCFVTTLTFFPFYLFLKAVVQKGPLYKDKN